MDQAKYVVHVEEEYGYRDWLWVPDMTIDELRAWWQKLPTVAPFFFDGPVSFPGEIHQIYFDTAWGPPMEFLTKISGDWATLSFEIEYEEPGMGFAGRSVFDNGEVSFAEEWEPEYEDEEEEDCDE